MRTMNRSGLLALFLAFACAAPAFAQWRYPPIYPGYPAYRYGAPESDLRINVKPNDASVYVDGYFAGKVEEFDGAFQRLHVAPGEHEIVIYLPGHRSLRQRLYLSPNSTRKIEGALEPLPAGHPPEPEPVPTEPREPRDTYERLPPRGPLPGRRAPAPRNEPQERPEPRQESRFGIISLRVQPAGTTVLVDGERWAGPSGDERVLIQVPPGRHKIEAEKEGFARFVTEIDVNRDQTVPVNISLTRPR